MTDPNVPPQSPESEDAVLGAIQMAPAALNTASEILAADDFYSLANGRIYTAALDLHRKGDPVDVVTLSNATGEKTRCYELAAMAISTSNVAHYAKIVKDKAIRRRLGQAGLEMIQAIHGENTGTELLERFQQNLYNLGQASSTTDDTNVPAAVKATYDLIVSGSRDMLGAPSGLADLDRVTRGFRPGDLIVLAADTGRGKSALALGAAMHLLGQGRPVAFFSLEMSDAELIQRAISLESGIPHDRLTRGALSDTEHRRLVDACQTVTAAPLKLRTDATIRPSGIRSELRRWKAQNPDGALAIVDYLQLLTPDDKSDNRTVDVSAISRALKIAAMDVGVPILALSQFHRRVNLDERPHRSNLRESGSIENDASVVILVHRPSKWDEDPQRRGTAEVVVAKNRHGAEAVITVKWTPEQMRFGNWVHDPRALAA